jgi:uncharacterized NAD(P)/FAD-binding protein YdhS
MIMSLVGRGHRGKIIAVSRHGLLPLPHRNTPSDPMPARILPERPTGLGALLRSLRRAAVDARDWRAVVDGLRPHTDEIWAGLTVPHREQFLRHLSRYWEVHRHRVAPASAEAIRRLHDAGTVAVRRGRILSLASATSGFEARVLLPDATIEHWRPDAVVNCTGPGRPAGLALVRTLVADGLARADPLHLGVEVDGEGRLVRVDGQPHRGLTVVGALRRGRWFETTAIPEIRTQRTRSRARLSGPRPSVGSWWIGAG